VGARRPCDSRPGDPPVFYAFTPTCCLHSRLVHYGCGAEGITPNNSSSHMYYTCAKKEIIHSADL